MDKEETKAYQKAYRETHKEEIRAVAATYYEAHKEYTKARNRAYYETHKEEAKACHKAYNETHKEENKARWKAYGKTYYEANKEKVKVRHKAYRKTHKEEARTYAKAYGKAHAEERCAITVKRRALKIQAMLPTTDNELIKNIYKQRGAMTKGHGEQYHVDHIIPLCIGGAHHQDNLRVITATENLEKGNRYIPELGGVWADNKLARKNRKKYEAL